MKKVVLITLIIFTNICWGRSGLNWCRNPQKTTVYKWLKEGLRDFSNRKDSLEHKEASQFLSYLHQEAIVFLAIAKERDKELAKDVEEVLEEIKDAKKKLDIKRDEKKLKNDL